MSGAVPADLDAARAELARLRADRARAGRVFYAVIPSAIGALLVAITANTTAHPLPLVITGGSLMTWGLLTAVGVVPALAPPRRYYVNQERLHYLEGFVDAATRDQRND